MTQCSLRRQLYVLCLTLLQPCTDLSYNIALWLTRRLGLYDGIVQTSLEETRPRSLSLLIFSRDSFGNCNWARFQIGAQPTLVDVTIYFWCNLFYNQIYYPCGEFLWPLHFGRLLVCGCIRKIIYKNFMCDLLIIQCLWLVGKLGSR